LFIIINSCLFFDDNSQQSKNFTQLSKNITQSISLLWRFNQLYWYLLPSRNACQLWGSIMDS